MFGPRAVQSDKDYWNVLQFMIGEPRQRNERIANICPFFSDFFGKGVSISNTFTSV